MTTLKGKVSWIDILKPTGKDLNWLRKKFHFHPVIIDELKGLSARAKVEFHKGYLYLIYYFPIYDPEERVSRRGEIDFLITQKEVITVSYEKIKIFDDFKKLLSPKSHIFENTLLLTHKLLESLLAFQQRQLVHIGEKVDAVSAELFKERAKERERALLERISYLKRDISQYRIIVKPQRHILESFLGNGCGFLGPNCQVYINDLIGEYIKVIDQLADYQKAVEDFETTNNQLINIKNSQVVRTFTIMAFLTFPMMLFAAIFSMNTAYTPIVNERYGFWLILGVMAVSIVGMFRHFRKRDWL